MEDPLTARPGHDQQQQIDASNDSSRASSLLIVDMVPLEEHGIGYNDELQPLLQQQQQQQQSLSMSQLFRTHHENALLAITTTTDAAFTHAITIDAASSSSTFSVAAESDSTEIESHNPAIKVTPDATESGSRAEKCDADANITSCGNNNNRNSNSNSSSNSNSDSHFNTDTSENNDDSDTPPATEQPLQSQKQQYQTASLSPTTASFSANNSARLPSGLVPLLPQLSAAATPTPTSATYPSDSMASLLLSPSVSAFSSFADGMYSNNSNSNGNGSNSNNNSSNNNSSSSSTPLAGGRGSRSVSASSSSGFVKIHSPLALVTPSTSFTTVYISSSEIESFVSPLVSNSVSATAPAASEVTENHHVQPECAFTDGSWFGLAQPGNVRVYPRFRRHLDTLDNCLVDLLHAHGNSNININNSSNSSNSSNMNNSTEHVEFYQPWIMPSPHALRSGARRSTNLTGHTRSSSSSSSGTATTPSPSSLSPAHSATSVRSTLSRERSFSDCTPACGGSGVVVGNDSIAAVSLAVNAATKSNSNSSIHRGGRSYRSFTAPSSDDRSRSITNSAATSTSIINLSAVRTRLLHQPPQTATVGSSHGGLFVHPLLQSRPPISAPSSRPSIISNLSTHTYSSTVTSNTASSSSTTATTTTAGGREQQQQQQQRVRFSIQPPQQPLPPPPPQQLDIGYITHLASLPHNPPRVSLNDLDPFAMKSGWIWYLDTLSASATSTATTAAATSSEHDKGSGVGSSASAAARRLLTRSKQWKRRYLILIGIPRDQHHSQPQPQPPSISEAMMDEGTNEVDVFVKSPRSEPKAARHLKVLGEVSCCLYRFKSSPSSQSPPQPADFSQSMVSLVSMDSISSLQQQQPQSPLDVIRRKHRSNSAGEWSEKALRLTADTVAFVSNQYPEREWVIEIRQPKQLNNGSSFSGGYQSGSATASSSSSIHSVPSDTSMSNSVNGGSGSGGGSGRSDVSGAPYNTFFLQAEDKDDMMQWLNSLRSIIARLYYAARPLPPVPRHVVGSANSTASTATPVSTISSIMPSPHVLVPIPLMDEVLLVEHNFPVVDDGDSMEAMDDNNVNDDNDDSDSELPEIFSPTMCAILGTGEQTQQRPTDKAARLLGIPSAGNMPLPIQPRAVTIATPVPSKIRTDAGQAASGGYSWMSAALQPPSISTASLNTTTTTASDSFGCVTSPDSLKVGSIRELHSFNATTTTTTTTSSNASDSFCMQNDASHFRQYDAAALAAATAATAWLPQSDLLVKPLPPMPPMPHPLPLQSHQLQQIPKIHQRQSSLRSTPVAVAVGSGSINAIQKRLGVENKDLHVALSESRRPSAIAAGHVASTMSRASRMTSAELRRSISLYDLHSPQQPAFTTVATTSHASATAPQSRPSEPRGFMNLDDDDDEIEESYDSFAQTPVNAPFSARNGSFSSSNLSNIFSGQQKKLGKRGSKIHSILLGSGSVDISGNNNNNSSGGGGSGGGSKGSALSKIVRLVRPKKMPSLTSFPTPTKQSLQLQQLQQHYQQNAHQLSKQSYYHHHTPDYWIPTISADFAASSATLNHINN